MLRKIIIKFVTKTNLVILIGTQNVLSVLSVFLSPIPIPPKTSIGLLTGLSAVVVFFLIVFWKRKQIVVNKRLQVVDWLVVGFVISNALSLVASQYIFELTNFRLLLIAVVQYVAIRLVDFSEKEKHRFFYIIGVTTILVASISLFQLVFREQAIILAKRFLFGDAAYSIAWDLGRGRGPQWGNIVISFPLFIGSILLLKKRNIFLNRLYIWLGIFLIPLSFITSNFRWLMICFLIGLFFYIFMLFRYKLLIKLQFIRILVPVVVSMIIGVFIASSVFQYNLIDRFLFKEKQRDVVFSLGRLFLYQQAIYVFTASPIVGIGTGNYRYIVERPIILHYYNYISGGESGVDETDRESVSSHNDILTILAETGIFGIAIYMSINYIVVRRLISYLRVVSKIRDTHRAIIPLSVLTAVFLFYLIGVFENTAPNNMVFVFFLYAVSVSWFQSGVSRVTTRP